MIMKVELLHTKSCHIWQEALKVLDNTLKEQNMTGDVVIRTIKNNREAAEQQFAGSPQIKINGKDIDPVADKINTSTANSCRQYFYKGNVYEYPPKEMILLALKRL